MELRYKRRIYYSRNLEVEEVPVTGELYSVNPTKGGIALVLIGCNNVNITHLALRTFRDSGEESKIKSVFLVDNGSKEQNTFNMMKQFVDQRGEGQVLKLNLNTGHEGPLELIWQYDFIDPDYILMFDNDVEILKGGGVDEAMSLMAVDVFAAGRDRSATWGNLPYGGKRFEPTPSVKDLAKSSEWWISLFGVSTDYTIWDFKLYKEFASKFYPTGYWDLGTLIFYDQLTRMGVESIKAGYRLAAYDVHKYVYHNSGFTTYRKFGSYYEKDLDERYNIATQKLRLKGVPESELFEDKI